MADADAMVKEMEDRGVDRQPRAMVGWQIPGEQNSATPAMLSSRIKGIRFFIIAIAIL